MNHLHQRLAQRVDQWRADGYPLPQYPVLAEILEWAREGETETLRFLRRPQLHALETYWYLRLVEGTPHIFDLYCKVYPPDENLAELLESLGVPDSAFKAANYKADALWAQIKTDGRFVQDFKLESLRETLSLDYPSYILALAMGAGKTILIGAIIATEFAMALEYPNDPGAPFVQNALVFAPGKTILESLRELAEIPYEHILPPRLHKGFAASVKLTFTRDGEKDVPVIRGSLFNVVVTNTEKIRIQKETIRKADLGNLFAPGREDEARAEIANLRLQAIASLPHLAVFSDEAHHTYGQSLDTGLKKVRKTVDYLAAKTNLVCVVNTTGTPYFQRQSLKDVVIWYGLSAGIKDGILKDLAGNIHAYDFSGDAKTYVSHVIEDFFRDYGVVRLPNGAPAKLALYFPQTDDLKELKPVIDQALVKMRQSPTLCLVNTSDESLTKQADIDAFNRLNDPTAPHRVILLVNKGTEGWNCPSLFACALARKLKTSNNFVLQATTRCLRQVPGNGVKARVYLSMDNFSVLDRQLQETYGETIADLNRSGQETRSARIILRKLDLPPLVVPQMVSTVVKKEGATMRLRLERPAYSADGQVKKTVHTLADQQATVSVLRQVGDTVTIDAIPEVTDAYAAAVDLAARYRLDLWVIYDELRRVYGEEDIPLSHIDDLATQIEEQTRCYEIQKERVDVALALVKPEGFLKETDASGVDVYTADIVYPKDREYLLFSLEQMRGQNPCDFGFHYTPYNFDSNPEKSFFEQMLANLNLHPSEVEDIYFTGALTDPNKTDFFVEYKDDKGKWRRYTPDFIIRKKPKRDGRPGTGKVFIVEIKREHDRAHPVDGEHGKKAMALRRWETLNPNRLKYQMIFTATDAVPADEMRVVRRFVEEPCT
ncbi:MAG: DEAD/DEAH box helicase family protein [Candidatus Methylomirabilis oxyfera]|nr:DEAD/DEAH box helicase family protein [Candidatus Methylomirabilis oxyfera]